MTKDLKMTTVKDLIKVHNNAVDKKISYEMLLEKSFHFMNSRGLGPLPMSHQRPRLWQGLSEVGVHRYVEH